MYAKQDDGFTLIELLVVVLIIGILSAIAVPAFLTQRERTWDAEAKLAARNAGIVFTTAFMGLDPTEIPLDFRDPGEVKKNKAIVEELHRIRKERHLDGGLDFAPLPPPSFSSPHGPGSDSGDEPEIEENLEKGVGIQYWRESDTAPWFLCTASRKYDNATMYVYDSRTNRVVEMETRAGLIPDRPESVANCTTTVLNNELGLTSGD